MSGLLKLTLTLERAVPANAHLRVLNPHVAAANLGPTCVLPDGERGDENAGWCARGDGLTARLQVRAGPWALCAL